MSLENKIVTLAETIGADVRALKSDKVDKVTGKGLSDTNFTQAEKTKLTGIEVGATKNRADTLNADKTHTHTTAQVAGLDTALAGKADKTTQVIAGTGLSGGGTLDSNRTLAVTYGTAAGTATQGNDSRLSNSREWTAATISQAEAEAGVATTRRAWTAQSVRQAANSSIAAQNGSANGIASLDVNGKIPLSQLSDSIIGQVEYMGLWAASTNTPTLPTTPAEKGHYYVVSASGTQFGHSFVVGDWAISNGTSWDKVDNTDAVSSVNGRTGNVTGLAESNDSRFTNSREWTATTITQAEAEAGTATTRRAFTAQSVRQAIVAWWNNITGAFGRDLVTSSSNSVARDKLGLSTSALRWPTFAEVTDKPTSYTPSAHTHPWAQVTGQPATATRWPTFAEVTGKPTNYATTWASVAAIPATATRWPTFDEVTGKPTTYTPSSHMHPVSQVTGLGTAAIKDEGYFALRAGTATQDFTTKEVGTVAANIRATTGSEGVKLEYNNTTKSLDFNFY